MCVSAGFVLLCVETSLNFKMFVQIVVGNLCAEISLRLANAVDLALTARKLASGGCSCRPASTISPKIY